MEGVDTGIRMLVDAITGSQYSAHSVTSTPIRETPNRYQAISMEKGLTIPTVTDVNNLTEHSESANSSINSGYNADTSNVLPCDYKSPAKANNQPSKLLTSLIVVLSFVFRYTTDTHS